MKDKTKERPGALLLPVLFGHMLTSFAWLAQLVLPHSTWQTLAKNALQIMATFRMNRLPKSAGKPQVRNRSMFDFMTRLPSAEQPPAMHWTSGLAFNKNSDEGTPPDPKHMAGTLDHATVGAKD